FIAISSLHASPSSLLFPLSLHDALPIFLNYFSAVALGFFGLGNDLGLAGRGGAAITSSVASRPSPTTATVTVPPLTNSPNSTCSDRKSTRLNSSHVKISYAVFCLKKKKK